MARRVITEPCNVPVNFRVTETMKKQLDDAADKENIPSTEWVRRAIQEKLDRPHNFSSELSDETFNAIVETVLKKVDHELERMGN